MFISLRFKHLLQLRRCVPLVDKMSDSALRERVTTSTLFVACSNEACIFWANDELGFTTCCRHCLNGYHSNECHWRQGNMRRRIISAQRDSLMSATRFAWLQNDIRKLQDQLSELTNAESSSSTKKISRTSC